MMMMVMNKKIPHTLIELHWQRERSKREMASRKLKANDIMRCDGAYECEGSKKKRWQIIDIGNTD